MVNRQNFLLLKKEYIIEAVQHLRQLVFEVTDRCNLKCKYCGYGELYCSYDERKSRDISLIKAKGLLDYLAGFWRELYTDIDPHRVSIGFYGGEPLLNVPFIKEIQNYISENYSGFVIPEYNMTTNAMLLDRYMDYLVENNFSLLISLDGDEEGQSYRVDHRGRNSFSTVIRNVFLLRDKYPEYFKKRVSFNAVLHNKNSTQGLYDFFKNNIGKLPMISELNNSGIREDKRNEFEKIFVSKQTDLYNSFNSEALIDEMFYDVADTKSLYSYLEGFSNNIYKSYVDLLPDKSQMSYLQTGTCIPFSKKMFLTTNGKILACERIDQKFALGYITDEGADLDFEMIVETYNRRYLLLRNQCAKCYRSRICSQCFYYIKDIDEKPICDGYMDKIGFDCFQKAQEQFLAEHPYLYKRILDKLTIY